MAAKAPKPDCATCGKGDKQIKKLEQFHDWECSHVECPNRRQCWGADPIHRPAAQRINTDVFAPLFEKVED
jgi:hypothetical protein